MEQDLGVLNEEVTDVCRICYLERTDEELIRPCKCSGSLAFVHPECLDSWVSSRGSLRCEICQANFPPTVNYKWWHAWRINCIREFIRDPRQFYTPMINVMTSMLVRPLILMKSPREMKKDLAQSIHTMLFFMMIACLIMVGRNFARYIAWKREWRNRRPQIDEQ